MLQFEGHVQGQDPGQDLETGGEGEGHIQGQGADGHEADLTADLGAGQEVELHRAGQGHNQDLSPQIEMKLEKTENFNAVEGSVQHSSEQCCCMHMNRQDCQIYKTG